MLPNTSAMANSAGYPATSVPNGFRESGSPAAITFYARPFGETALLALTRAYQDATSFHLRHPNLEALPRSKHRQCELRGAAISAPLVSRSQSRAR